MDQTTHQQLEVEKYYEVLRKQHTEKTGEVVVLPDCILNEDEIIID